MIRTLRRRHFILFLILAVLLPILFIAGLFARKPIAVMNTIPEPLLSEGTTAHEP